MKSFKGILFILVSLALTLGIARAEDKKDTGESKQKPEAIFAQSCKKPDEVKGFHLKITVAQEVGKDKESMVSTGKQQNPDSIYLESSTGSETYGKGKFITVRSSPKSKWQSFIPPGVKDQEIIPLKQIMKACGHSKEAKFIENAELQGIKCQGIEMSLTDEGISKIIPSIALVKNTKYHDAFYRLWYDPKTLLPYKVIFTIKITVIQEDPFEEEESKQKKEVTSIQTITIDIFDYDKNIEIKFPDEVKKIFEAKESAKPGEEKPIEITPPLEEKKSPEKNQGK